jgi:hypothetical protein
LHSEGGGDPNTSRNSRWMSLRSHVLSGIVGKDKSRVGIGGVQEQEVAELRGHHYPEGLCAKAELGMREDDRQPQKRRLL